VRKAADMPPMLGICQSGAIKDRYWGRRHAYAPATKCGHDFAEAGLEVTDAAFVEGGGMTSPVSRDWVREVERRSEDLLLVRDREDVNWEVMHRVGSIRLEEQGGYTKAREAQRWQ
jgi:hypothetical protein